MLRCPKCNFLNSGDHPVKCTRCGQFVYHINHTSYTSRNDDEDDYTHVPTFGSFDRDRWNHEEDRPNTFVEDAMKSGSSGGGGNTQSFESDKEPEKEPDPEPERQDDPDPPTNNDSED